MAGALYPGRRVRLGWCPSHQIHGSLRDSDPRLQRGVLHDGPYLPGQVLTIKGRCHALMGDDWWLVALDGGGGRVLAPEHLIFPDDDGEPAETARHAEETTTP